MHLYRSEALNSRTLTVGTSATALPGESCYGLILQASPENTVNVFVGDSAGQHIQLLPGGSLSLMVSRTGVVFARAASSTAVVNYLVLK